MENYRLLREEEIQVLEQNGCWAEDWEHVMVDEAFKPYNFHRVVFYGNIRLGRFDKQVEVSKGFMKHSGINDATLRNVSVGNNCLIEKVGNFINNYTIGDDCYISNISTMETLEGASYGAGSIISVLNEMGDGNVVLFRELNSQLAAFMVKHHEDKVLINILKQLIDDEVRLSAPERGIIGNNVKIINTKEITNTVIKGDCEISGTSRLADCTIMSSKDASVYIGTGVICENSIICDGCSINNSVKMQDCFVGEACGSPMASQPRHRSSLPTRSWPTVRRVPPSAVPSQQAITRVRCLSADSSLSTTPVPTPTSPTMPTKWGRSTTEHSSAARRQPAVPMC